MRENNISPKSLSLNHLRLDSSVADLVTYSFAVDRRTTGNVIASQFGQHPYLPGVVVIEKQSILAVISRRRFLEQVGRPYGIEVYLNRPIGAMIDTIIPPHLTIDHDCLIYQAVTAALNRPSDLFYEPIVVLFPNRPPRLLDIYTLLLAQSHLMTLFYQEEQSQRQFAESLQKIGKAISSSLEFGQVTEKILKQLNRVVEFGRGAVFTLDGDTLTSVATRGFPKKHRRQPVMVQVQDLQDDVFRRIVRTKRPLILDDVTTEETWIHVDGLPLHYSWMGVPLIVQDRVVGMVSLTRAEKDAFSSREEKLVTAISSQAAVALENARLYADMKDFSEQLEERVQERTTELNRAYNLLEKLDQSKSDFISVSAHELRTPLTVMKGYAQMLKMLPNVSGDSTAMSAVGGVLTGIDRLHYIVNNMLDVVKIDSDSLSLFIESISVVDLIKKVAHQLRNNLEERHQTLELQLQPDLPHMQGDMDLIEKVIYGLLVNAIKYTPDGGRIKIECQSNHELADEHEIAVIEMVVTDSGIGIDPEQLEIIFEKFYQTGPVALHSSGLTKFKGGGPGLGLAIAKGVVEAHGGRIWAESVGYDEQRCPGSSFYVILPIDS